MNYAKILYSVQYAEPAVRQRPNEGCVLRLRPNSNRTPRALCYGQRAFAQ